MKQQGFTLIELLVVIVIVGILSAGLGTILMTGTQASTTAGQLLELSGAGELALAEMTEKMANIRSNLNSDIGVAISSGTSDQIVFTTVSGDEVAFYADSGFLYEDIDGEDALLSAYLENAPTFTYYDQDGQLTSTVTDVHFIGVVFTLTNQGHSETFSQVVYLRNSL